MPDIHSKTISPSAASRQLECTNAWSLEQKFPNTTSDFAREGTLAHEIAELTTHYFLDDICEMDFENKRDEIAVSDEGKRFYNTEMQEHANDYAQLIKKKLTEYRETCQDAFVALEVRSDFSKWVPDGFGTSDCVIVADDIIEIIDLKYGKGHRVSAKDNPQMKLYALGVYDAYNLIYDFKYIKMTIFQPRVNNTSSETITAEDLLKWADEYVKPRADEALSGKGTYRPGDETCKFCRAKNECAARYDFNLKLFDERPDPTRITPEEASRVLAQASDIKQWLTDLEEFVFASIRSGAKVPEWKIVEGKSNRTIKDEALAAAALHDAGYTDSQLYVKKFATLTSLESLCGKKGLANILGDLIIKPAGKPVLAPASSPKAEYVFEDEIKKAFDED